MERYGRWRKVSPGCAFAILLLSLLVVPRGAGAQEETVIAEHPLGSLTLEELRAAVDEVPRDRSQLRALVTEQALIDYGLVLAGNEGLEQSSRFLEILREKRGQALAELFVREQIEKPAEPTSAEVEAALGILFPQPYVLQIVVPTPEGAEEVLGRLASGEDFRSIAAEASVGLLSSRGGVVGYLDRGSGLYSSEEEDLLMSMKAGEVSAVVEGPLGFSVFTVEGIKSVEERREELLPKAKRSIYQEKRARRERDILQDLRRRYEASLNEEFIAGERDGDLLAQSTEVARIGKEPITFGQVFSLEDLSPWGLHSHSRKRRRIVNNYLVKELYRREGERLELDKAPEFDRTLKRINRLALWELYVESVVTPPKAYNVDIRIREDVLSDLLETR
jgi:hypothetical protein